LTRPADSAPSPGSTSAIDSTSATNSTNATDSTGTSASTGPGDSHAETGDSSSSSEASTGSPSSASSSGDDEGVGEEGSTGLHSCPGTGYCDSNLQANTGILDNHGHILTVPLEHIQACEQRDYDIQGDADHSHIITMLLGHYGEIDIGGFIYITSSVTNGHAHEVWLDCE
jgi:hypothetical protein